VLLFVVVALEERREAFRGLKVTVTQ